MKNLRLCFATLLLPGLLSCESLPNTMLPSLSDGAYGGIVVTRSTVTIDGLQQNETVNSAYYIVEIQDGRIQNVRIAPDKNGPFGCWIIEPGSTRTVPFSLNGMNGTSEATVIAGDSQSLTFTVYSSIGQLVFSGEGEITIIPNNDSIHFLRSSSMSGSGTSVVGTVEGDLFWLGPIGATPTPVGMNGFWKNTFPNGGADGVEIRALRVTLYYPFEGPQDISNSQPVAGTGEPGSSILIRFVGSTSFLADPTVREYTVTIQGIVQPDGSISCTTEFKPTDQSGETRIFETTIARIGSDEC